MQNANNYKTPDGLHWHRHGKIWYLVNQNFRYGHPHTILGYVTCERERGQFYWHAVYRPDTIECIAFETRQEAQRLLIDTIISRPV